MMISALIKTYQKLGYPVFETDSKPFNLNIYGIRNLSGIDELGIFWKHNGKWSIIRCLGTTDPTKYYLENPLNRSGTFIMKKGFYKGLWKLGLHRGKYQAFVQNGVVSGYRDDDRDNLVEIDPSTLVKGFFGINGHKSKGDILEGKASAGCQVWEDEHEYEIIMHIADQAKLIWGNSFSYALFDEEEIIK